MRCCIHDEKGRDGHCEFVQYVHKDALTSSYPMSYAEAFFRGVQAYLASTPLGGVRRPVFWKFSAQPGSREPNISRRSSGPNASASFLSLIYWLAATRFPIPVVCYLTLATQNPAKL
jgi:hypothetical protein